MREGGQERAGREESAGQVWMIAFNISMTALVSSSWDLFCVCVLCLKYLLALLFKVS